MNLEQQFDQLYQLLSTQAEQILRIVRSEPGAGDSPFILLPTPSQVDLSMTNITEYVAITSNEFAKATRLAGICRALLKTSEGHYKQKYKMALGEGAKNQAEREANAHKAAQAEYNTFITVSALVELAESWEAACRIASESSRRMLLTVEAANRAEGRMASVSSGDSYESQRSW